MFGSGGALTVLSLMGIAIIFALSYNMLLGQTGMLSFGHAVYYGLGGFFVVHAMNAIGAARAADSAARHAAGRRASPGLSSRCIFGWVSTKRAGTAFAMISLGVAELVALLLADPAQLLRRRRRHHRPTAPRCCACSTGISARRSRSTT